MAEFTTQARIGYGTIFRVGNNDSPQTFTDIAEVTSVSPPPIQRDILDATHMQSPGGWREFIPGLKDGGEVKFDMNFLPGNATQDILIQMQAETTPRDCQIEFPNGESWGFAAYCTGFEPEAPVDDKMTASVTMKVTGQPQFISS